MSLPGWIVVHASPALVLAGARVVAGGVAGRIGQAIPAPPELVAVVIDLPIRLEHVAVDVRIDVIVPVTSARTTEIELPATQILRRAE
jgi:hypothetical protein